MNPEQNAAIEAAVSRVLTGAGWDQFRAWHQENLSVNVQQGFLAPVAGIMVGSNRPNRTLGQELFRPVPVGMASNGNTSFRYKVFGLEAWLAQDTRRSASAPFKTGGRLFNYANGSLERRGFAAMLDRDDLANADATTALFGAAGVDLRFYYGKIARDMVENDLELQRATAVLALSATTLSTPWDDSVNGDSKASIQAAVNTLASANNVQPDQIGVIITRASREALMSDPTMIAANRAFGTLPQQPTLDRIRDYWGVGSVMERDFFYSTDGTTQVSAYGDIAVLYVMRDALGNVDTRENSNDGFVDFTWENNGGLHLTPVYKGVEVEGVATSWLFPYESWATPTLVSATALAVIKNTKS